MVFDWMLQNKMISVLKTKDHKLKTESVFGVSAVSPPKAEDCAA
jgi:hypothetical protein